MMSSPTTNNSRGVLVAVLIAAALVRCAGVARATWLDESFTLRWVQAATWREWLAAVHNDHQAPAYPVLLTAWASISTTLPWLRLCSVACGVATVVLGMRWAAAASKRAALPAALLLSSSPFLLRYAVELRAYALVGAASAWVGLASWRVASSHGARRRDTASLLAALLLACLTHFTAILLVPAAIALVLAGASERRVARVPWLGLGGVCAIWAIVVVASNAHGVVGRGWWMPALTPRLAWFTFAEVLGLPSSGMPAVAQIAWVTLLVALAAVFIVAEPAREWTAPLCAALIYWLCLAGVSLLWEPVWWPRTMLPGLVLLLVSVAIASTRLRPPWWTTAAAVVVATLSLFGVVRWLGGEARNGLEPWQQVANNLPAPQTSSALFAVPDYAVEPLVELADRGRAGVAALRLDGRGNHDIITATLARAGQGRPVTLVVRVDLTVMASPEALTAVLADVAEARGSAPVRVLLVMSPDASLVPALRDTRMQVVASATRLFGPLVERRDEPSFTSLTFASPR